MTDEERAALADWMGRPGGGRVHVAVSYGVADITDLVALAERFC